MQALWSHKTSVTRDFTVLSVVIVFIAVLASVWVAYETFVDQSRKIGHELETEAERIDRAFHSEIERASYLLEAIGRQIIQRGTNDKTIIAQMLRSYDTNNDFYSVFLWVDDNQQAVTSSRQGVLEKPVDISDRGYIKKSLAEPFAVQIGKPLKSRVSERLIIPLSMGLTDYTGKYIGTVTLSLDLERLTQNVQDYLRNDKVAFSILNESMTTLTKNQNGSDILTSETVARRMESLSVEPGNRGILTAPSLFSSNRTFAYYLFSNRHNYVILTGLESRWTALSKLMLPRMVQLAFIAAFLVSLLWLVRFRVIYPVQNLAEVSAEIARGKADIIVPQGGPLEVSNLSQQLQKIVDYIAERKRIEEELVGKVLALKTAKDITEVSDLAKMEILTILKQEILPATDKILSASSILNEQPYGKIKGEEYAGHIAALDASSTHLAEVLHEILEFPKLDRMESILNRKPVDVRALAYKCTTLLADTLESEEVSVHIRVPDDLPKLAINELHLMHVVGHLMLACVRSIPAGGELTIEASLEESDNQTEFAIFFKDNGTGLDTQHIARLWRASEQGRRSQSFALDDDRDLTPSAITLTKKIISIHNGRMTMQNPPGKEAIIAVYFQQ